MIYVSIFNNRLHHFFEFVHTKREYDFGVINNEEININDFAREIEIYSIELMSYSDNMAEIKDKIETIAKEIDPTYRCVISLDYDYTSK